MKLELHGGPMDGDKTPSAWAVRERIYVESDQQDSSGNPLAHEYQLSMGGFHYQGKILRTNAQGPLIPLRIGEKLGWNT